MSAFIVSNKHINSILTGANQARLERIYISKFQLFEHDIDLVPSQNFDGNYIKFDFNQLHDMQVMATILLTENYRSVNYRYSEQSPIEPIKFNLEPVGSFIQVIKLIDCLDYQSCETESWELSLSYKVITRIKEQLVKKMLKSVGYDDLDWAV